MTTPRIGGVRHTSYVRLDALTPAVRNPRGHDLEGIKASMQRFGFTEPMLIDERTERLVAGHGRQEALVELRQGGSRLPEGLLVDEDGEWLVPVTRGWMSKNDAEVEALIILLNRLTERGTWVDQMLVEMLHDVQAVDVALFEQLDFSSEEMDGLLSTVDADRLGQFDETEGPIGAAAAHGQDEDTDLDDLEDGATLSLASEDPSVRHTCPACGHRWTPTSME